MDTENEIYSHMDIKPHDQYLSPYFNDLLKTGSDTHIQWHLVHNMMNTLVRRFDVIIFGGAVRDSILHSHAAGKFYFLCENTDVKIKDYDDPLIHPELSDRFLIPNDIDFFIDLKKYTKFTKYLHEKHFYFKEKRSIDLSYINANVTDGDYRLIKGEVVYFNQKNNKPYFIQLDIILCRETKIPPMNSDFSVNKLILSKVGIESNLPNSSFQDIKQQIHKKEAYCDSSITEKRYEKMCAKGWKVIMNYSTFTFKLRVNEEEETCVICLDNLKVGELEVSSRVCKCKYSYCKDCLKYSLKSYKCLMCKIDMCIRKKECDIKMYEKTNLLG